jgi:hypothetical protein
VAEAGVEDGEWRGENSEKELAVRSAEENYEQHIFGGITMAKTMQAMAGRVAMAMVLLTAVVAMAVPVDTVHIAGNVSALVADKLTVSIESNSVDVMLLPTTKYFLGVKPGKREDVQVGDKVDVSAEKVNGEWQAERVKYTHVKK